MMSDTDSFSALAASTAFFTGHRILDAEESTLISDRLFCILSDAYEAGYRNFYCGCALGFDTIAAFQTLRLREHHPDVRLLLAIPCATQADRWAEQDRIVYRRILDSADRTEVLSPVYYKGAMLTRNRYMADRSSLCICYLRKMSGGTASTVRYALLHDRIRIINLAIGTDCRSVQLRENTWSCMFISPSVSKNAGTAGLLRLSGRKLTLKNTSV